MHPKAERFDRFIGREIIISTALRIAVCEDQPEDSRKLLDIIENSAYSACLSVFEQGAALLSGFHKGMYHLIFLDIYLPGDTGIEIARAIRRLDDCAVIVFVTTSIDHTLEGYRLGALKYIEKPYIPAQINEALYLAWTLMQNREVCTLMTAQGKTEVPLSDICYVEASNHISILHLTDGQKQVSMKIRALSELLPSPPFVWCHRSYIVNLAHVRSVDRDFIMENGDRVYIRGKDERKMAGLFASYLAAEARRIGNEDGL